MKVNQQCNPRKSLKKLKNIIDLHTTAKNHDALFPKKKNNSDSPDIYNRNRDTPEFQIPACNGNLNGVTITEVKYDMHVSEKKRTVKEIDTKG